MDADFWKDCPDVEVDPEKPHGDPTVGPYRVAAAIRAFTLKRTVFDHNVPAKLARYVKAFDIKLADDLGWAN